MRAAALRELLTVHQASTRSHPVPRRAAAEEPRTRVSSSDRGRSARGAPRRSSPARAGSRGSARSTGSTRLDRRRRSRRASPRTSRPSAQSPSATTRRGSGIAAYAVSRGPCIRVVTGPGDQQDVRVARRGDDPDAEALEVGVGARREDQLVLAAVARAAVDVADARGCGRGRVSGERSLGAGGGGL